MILNFIVKSCTSKLCTSDSCVWQFILLLYCWFLDQPKLVKSSAHIIYHLTDGSKKIWSIWWVVGDWCELSCWLLPIRATPVDGIHNCLIILFNDTHGIDDVDVTRQPFIYPEFELINSNHLYGSAWHWPSGWASVAPVDSPIVRVGPQIQPHNICGHCIDFLCIIFRK